MPDPGGNIYPFPGTRRPANFSVPLHTYINIPPWSSKQNSPSRLAAAAFHLVTDEVLSHLPPLPDAGLVHLFVERTSRRAFDQRKRRPRRA